MEEVKRSLTQQLLSKRTAKHLSILNASYFKTKCFQYHPTAEANKKDEWEKCIQAIDGKNVSKLSTGKNRALKTQKNAQL